MKHSKDNTIAAADAEEEGCNAAVLADWQNSFVDCVAAADQEAARTGSAGVSEVCSVRSEVAEILHSVSSAQRPASFDSVPRLPESS